MKQADSRTAHFGGPTVLTVLLTLCMVCLALLALTRAGAHHRMIERGAQTAAAYYEAETAAMQLLTSAADCRALPPETAAETLSDRAVQKGGQAAYEAQTGLLRLSFPAGTQGDYILMLTLSADGQGTRFAIVQSRLAAAEQQEQNTVLPVFGQQTGEQTE